MTTKEAEQVLQLSRAKVYQLIEQQAIVGVKVGTTWRIRTDSVAGLVGFDVLRTFFTRGNTCEKALPPVPRVMR